MTTTTFTPPNELILSQQSTASNGSETPIEELCPLLKNFEVNLEKLFEIVPHKNPLYKGQASGDNLRKTDPVKMINRKVTGKTRCMGVKKCKSRRKTSKG